MPEDFHSFTMYLITVKDLKRIFKHKEKSIYLKIIFTKQIFIAINQRIFLFTSKI